LACNSYTKENKITERDRKEAEEKVMKDERKTEGGKQGKASINEHNKLMNK
jgi:hypothetical protein